MAMTAIEILHRELIGQMLGFRNSLYGELVQLGFSVQECANRLYVLCKLR